MRPSRYVSTEPAVLRRGDVRAAGGEQQGQQQCAEQRAEFWRGSLSASILCVPLAPRLKQASGRIEPTRNLISIASGSSRSSSKMAVSIGKGLACGRFSSSRIQPLPRQRTLRARVFARARHGATAWVAYHIGGRPAQ